MSDKEAFSLPQESSLFMDLLVQALVPRIKEALNEWLVTTISENLPKVEVDAVEGLDEKLNHFFEDSVRNFNVEADDVKGLDRFVEQAIEEENRNLKVDVDSIENLDEAIDKAVENALKNGTFNIEFNSI